MHSFNPFIRNIPHTHNTIIYLSFQFFAKNNFYFVKILLKFIYFFCIFHSRSLNFLFISAPFNVQLVNEKKSDTQKRQEKFTSRLLPHKKKEKVWTRLTLAWLFCVRLFFFPLARIYAPLLSLTHLNDALNSQATNKTKFYRIESRKKIVELYNGTGMKGKENKNFYCLRCDCKWSLEKTIACKMLCVGFRFSLHPTYCHNNNESVVSFRGVFLFSFVRISNQHTATFSPLFQAMRLC